MGQTKSKDNKHYLSEEHISTQESNITSLPPKNIKAHQILHCRNIEANSEKSFQAYRRKNHCISLFEHKYASDNSFLPSENKLCCLQFVQLLLDAHRSTTQVHVFHSDVLEHTKWAS